MSIHFLEDSEPTSWETVAAFQLSTSLNRPVANVPATGFAAELNSLFELRCDSYAIDYNRPLNLLKAYCRIDSSPKELSYFDILAIASLLPEPNIDEPLITTPSQKYITDEPIVVAPFGCKEGLNLSEQVWRTIKRFLVSYGRRVVLLGEGEQRLNASGYPEADIYTKCSLDEKIDLLHSAALIIGVPNAWTWLATGQRKKMIILYPEGVPLKRWFPYAHDNYARLLFDRENIQTPLMLAGMRKLIAEM